MALSIAVFHSDMNDDVLLHCYCFLLHAHCFIFATTLHPLYALFRPPPAAFACLSDVCCAAACCVQRNPLCLDPAGVCLCAANMHPGCCTAIFFLIFFFLDCCSLEKLSLAACVLWLFINIFWWGCIYCCSDV